MSTSIRVSDETKRKLEAIKRDDESYDDLLDRLATFERPMEAGVWAGSSKAAHARDAIKRTRESFE